MRPKRILRKIGKRFQKSEMKILIYLIVFVIVFVSVKVLLFTLNLVNKISSEGIRTETTEEFKGTEE